MTKHIICVFTLDQALDLGMYLTIIITIFGIFLYIVNVIWSTFTDILEKMSGTKCSMHGFTSVLK